MKNGYVVMNNSNYGIEIFGVYKNKDRAVTQLRKVIRNRFGRCPRNFSKLYELGQPNGPDSDDSYMIMFFEENNGEE